MRYLADILLSFPCFVSGQDMSLAFKGSATITSVSDASGTITLNCNSQSQKSFYVILTGTGRTVTLSNAVQNGVYTLQIFQDATGSRTITTWTNGKYPGQTIPTQTSAANSQDMAVITYKNGYYYIHYNNNY